MNETGDSYLKKDPLPTIIILVKGETNIKLSSTESAGVRIKLLLLLPRRMKGFPQYHIPLQDDVFYIDAVSSVVRKGDSLLLAYPFLPGQRGCS